ncbi:DUF6063 family protein [Psychrobacillus sp. L4]|uniref:DUF6063 family protein n=1 Tax=Psychrobacillus sp. L4 TaxID=3236892 RepID=UPI0036F25946
MHYDEMTVMKAFELYKTLILNGVVEKSYLHEYNADEYVRGLVDRFAQEVDCVTLTVGDQLFMIPKTKLSPFHVNNDFLKRTYLKTSATNADLYLLYFATIVLIGEFYDSYHSKEPTRDFIGLDAWVLAVQKRIDTLKEHSTEELKAFEGEFSYNWIAIIEKWDAMDDLKEQAKKQTGNTISRLSFLDTVKRFLLDQSLIEEIGNNEITISEKAKTIVQRYFMDLDYNRGILEFLYELEAHKKEVQKDAIDLED